MEPALALGLGIGLIWGLMYLNELYNKGKQAGPTVEDALEEVVLIDDFEEYEFEEENETS